MKYLEAEEITEAEIKAALRKGTIAVKAIPVLCGSSYKNKGVQRLLDAIVDYMPSPVDIEAIKGVSVDGETEIERHASDDEPFSALAFKIMSDRMSVNSAFLGFTRKAQFRFLCSQCH